MKTKAEVVVVGGGVVGTCTAYYLARKGADVLLVEAHDLAGGTSGACDQAVMLQSKNPGLPLAMALASAEIYRHLEAELDTDLEYHQNGGMIVIENETEWAVMEEIAARQQAAGLAVRLLDRTAARERQPALAPHILGATHWDGDAAVNPIRVCLALARAARARGAALQLETRVTGLLRQGDRIVGVQTDRGEVRAGQVLLAAGVWTPELGRHAGLEIPIVPRRGQLLVTEPLPPLIRGDILSAGYLAVKHHPELMTGVAGQLGVGLSLGQTANGNLLIGATREFAGFDRRTTPEAIRAVAANAVRLVPALAGVRIIRTFAGLRPYTPDGLPVLGPVASRPGLYLAAGHEGDGIALAPFTGCLMADVLTGADPGWDLSPFRLERFGTATGGPSVH